MNNLKRLLYESRYVIIIFAVFVSGLLSGLGISYIFRAEVFFEERRAGQHEFINPLLECEGPEELKGREMVSLKGKIDALINEEIKKNKAKDVSVYFREMNGGQWFGIGDKGLFPPGSLLTMPVLIGYLKQAEAEPGILQRKIKFDSRLQPYYHYINPSNTMEFGKSYTIEELIHRMIVYSDDNAAFLLIQHDNTKVYESVFKDLGLTVPPETGAYGISALDYASFFRVLFNASYLNEEMSNLALKILNSADFNRGIVLGVPSNVPVTQKFGELTTEDYKQFHDCGIVYYPNYPYLLCVMTMGDDYENLTSIIKEISVLTYDEIDRQRGGNRL